MKIKCILYSILCCFAFPINSCNAAPDYKKVFNTYYHATPSGKVIDLPIIEINANRSLSEDSYADGTISVKNCESEWELNNVGSKIKKRGNWSAQQEKFGIKIKFENKQPMLGLHNGLKDKEWVLLPEYGDKSFLRDAIAYNLAHQLLVKDGYYCTDYSFVEMFLNGEYFGIYLLAEQQEISSKRINLYEPDDVSNCNIGYLMELDAYATGEDEYCTLNYPGPITALDNTSVNKGKFNCLYSSKNDDFNTERSTFIKNKLQSIFTTIYNAVNQDQLAKNSINTNVEDVVSSVIDVKSLVDIFILQEIMVNIDVGWSSFYLTIDYSDRGNKLLTFQAPWDFEWSLTCHSEAKNWWYTCNAHDFRTYADYMNPWLIILCKQNWFWSKVKDRWVELKNDNWFDNIFNDIDIFSEAVTSEAEKNFNKWPNSLHVEEHNSGAFITCKNQLEAASLVKDFLNARINFIDNNLRD